MPEEGGIISQQNPAMPTPELDFSGGGEHYQVDAFNALASFLFSQCMLSTYHAPDSVLDTSNLSRVSRVSIRAVPNFPEMEEPLVTFKILYLC